MEEQKYCFVQFKCSFKTIPGKYAITLGEELRVVGSSVFEGRADHGWYGATSTGCASPKHVPGDDAAPY